MNINMMMIFLLIILLSSTCHCSHAKRITPLQHILNHFDTFYHHGGGSTEFSLSRPLVVAGVLCFIASSISSAGGIGGGGLFIPILKIVAGLDLKTATSFSAFMVTGGSVANVVCNMFIRSSGKNGAHKINYDIALLSEPCMLLGVSIGVICNVVLPEWLITVLFAVFLAWTTTKTCKSGVYFWKIESENNNVCETNGNGKSGNEEDGFIISSRNTSTDEEERGEEEPLLKSDDDDEGQNCNKLEIPWVKLGVLLLIWLCFFLVYLLRGNSDGQGIISIEACGVGYWMISSIQIPLAIIFTTSIIFSTRSFRTKPLKEDQDIGAGTKCRAREKLIFPLMALLAGALGGLFGIGGGMLISPLLLQVGIPPEVTAATCSFMVFFSSTMSAIQYLFLEMEHPYGASAIAIVCFAGALIGLVVVQSAVEKHGRASVIVFSVGIVMALSTVLITCSGALDVWRDYTSGKYMGFKKPC